MGNILRINDLTDKLHVSRSTIYNLIAQDKTFPKPIKLSKRAVGFNSSEIDSWLEDKANETRKEVSA